MRGAVVVRAQLGILGGRSILSVHLKGIGGRRGKSLRLRDGGRGDHSVKERRERA